MSEEGENGKKAQPLDVVDIRGKGRESIMEYFNLSNKELENLPMLTLHHLHKKAQLGMSFEKEMGVATRSETRNTLRVLTLVAEDKKELRSLISKSLPQFDIHSQ